MENKTREEVVREELEDFFSFAFEKKYVPFKSPTGGNPRTYDTPKKLVDVMIKYLLPKMVENQPISIRGFINKSKMFSPDTFYRYKTYGEDYSKAISQFQGIVEDFNIGALYDNRHPGAKFALMCGYRNWVPTEHQIIEQKDFVVNIGHTSSNIEEETSD